MTTTVTVKTTTKTTITVKEERNKHVFPGDLNSPLKPMPKVVPSTSMRKLFQHINRVEEPAHLDDAADMLDDLDEKELANICGCEVSKIEMQKELTEIDLSHEGCGWLIEILGEGTVKE